MSKIEADLVTKGIEYKGQGPLVYDANGNKFVPGAKRTDINHREILNMISVDPNVIADMTNKYRNIRVQAFKEKVRQSWAATDPRGYMNTILAAEAESVQKESEDIATTVKDLAGKGLSVNEIDAQMSRYYNAQLGLESTKTAEILGGGMGGGSRAPRSSKPSKPLTRAQKDARNEAARKRRKAGK
jgi:hypothetical protein